MLERTPGNTRRSLSKYICRNLTGCAYPVSQFLEGLALGTVVNSASFGRVRSLAMAATYSLTCPVGIAIGVGVLNTIGNSSSWEANIVQVSSLVDDSSL